MQTPLTLAVQENPGTNPGDIEYAAEWLARYGYLQTAATVILSASFSPIMAVVQLQSALSQMQMIAGLKPTGHLDNDTLNMMYRPRCGVVDVFADDVRRMVLEAKWRKGSLSYFIDAYVTGLSQSDQDDLLKVAWQQWQDVCGIRLQRVASKTTADIVISTGKGRAQGMDGPSGTLAWAQLPPGNDQQLLMRFDIDETWTNNQIQLMKMHNDAAMTGAIAWAELPATRGIQYLNVACHEFGHLLGLDHSRIASALMAPYYAVGISKPQSNDDIPRIQALYGPAVTPMPPLPPINPSRVKARIDIDIEAGTGKILGGKFTNL